MIKTMYVCTPVEAQTKGPIMTTFGTDMWMDLGMFPSQKKLAPCMVRKGGLIGGNLGYLYH